MLVSVEDGEVDRCRAAHRRCAAMAAARCRCRRRDGLRGGGATHRAGHRRTFAQLPNHQPVALRLTLEGATAARGAFGDAARLRAEVIGQALARGGDRLWIEKLRLDTRPPEGAGKGPRGSDRRPRPVLAGRRRTPPAGRARRAASGLCRQGARRTPGGGAGAGRCGGAFDGLVEEVSAVCWRACRTTGDAQ